MFAKGSVWEVGDPPSSDAARQSFLFVTPCGASLLFGWGARGAHKGGPSEKGEGRTHVRRGGGDEDETLRSERDEIEKKEISKIV